MSKQTKDMKRQILTANTNSNVAINKEVMMCTCMCMCCRKKETLRN